MGNIYQKTHIGEHDLRKPACSEYCKMASDYCPFLANDISSVDKIVRWTDLAEKRLGELKDAFRESSSSSSSSESDYSYMSDFSKCVNDDGESVDRTDVETRLDEMASKSSSSPVDKNRGQISFELPAGRYTCWCDGSGFEYDLMSRNVIGDAGTAERVYDITGYGIEHEPLKFSEWNAWIDKFQYDYRFGRVSDFNAECVLFPNVDNPWMFTEYVFQGVGGDNSSGKIAGDIPVEYVVEPPLYDQSTLELINGDLTINDPANDYDGKYDDGKIVQGDSVRRFRTIENWDALTNISPDDLGLTKEQQSDPSVMKKYSELVDETRTPVKDAGVRLYRARIPVQSVKWGEHGNIPPHTLDMTAPADWMDPTASVTTVRATYVAHLGTPLYAHKDGYIYWEGDQAYIADLNLGQERYDTSGKRECLYDTSGTGDAVAMPAKMVRGEEKILSPTEKVMGSAGSPDLCHGGCALCIGTGGVARCGYLTNLPSSDEGGISEGNRWFHMAQCVNADLISEYGCPNKVTQRRHPLIATYQVETLQKDQVALNAKNAWAAGALLGLSGGVAGALAGGAMTATMMATEMDKMAQQYINLGKRKDVDITYELKYEAVKASKESPQLNKKKYNGFGKGVQIQPDTGRFALDTEENVNVFQGGDTNVYGDISTLSFHRFFRNVLHCATQEHCHFLAESDQSAGWVPGEKAGGDGKCRYYKTSKNGAIGCPYVNAPKRAIEFANTASRAYSILAKYADAYSNMTKLGCWKFVAGSVVYETLRRYRYEIVEDDEKEQHKWVVFDNEWAVMQESDTVAVVAVKLDTDTNNPNKVNDDIACSSHFAGMSLLADPDCLPNGFVKLCKFKTVLKKVKMNSRPWYKEGNDVMVDVDTYDVDSIFYWFKPLYNDGSDVQFKASRIECLQQHVDNKGYWFCRADRSVVVPTGNCVMVDNDEKFIGGWHPEYKDYSKMGSEFMQDIVSEESREGQGMGDYVTGKDYTPIPQTVNKKGYWVDQSGVYITDERSIGTNRPIAGNDARESNSGESPCISYRKSNTEIDGETGKQKQPKVLNGAVFANDPWRLILEDYKATGEDEYGRKTGAKPEFDDPDRENQKYHAPCRVKQEGLLPTMRHALYCPKCDYYIPIRYIGVHKCPWCGTEYELITGDDGSGFGEERYAAEGKTWDDNNPDASIIKKFFKIYSIGNVDVWAPPGTSLRTDAYFWRHQAQITNATKRQIYHRLGHCTAENGYSFDTMSRTAEMTLGFPEGIGRFEPVDNDDTNERLADVMKDIRETAGNENAPSHLAMFNRTMPRHMLPEFYGKADEGLEDEGIIAPYTSKSDDALKIVSSDQMRVLRNALEPMYAYVVKPDDEMEFPKDYPILRASYDQREEVNQNIIYRNRRATISPIVIGMTDDTRDSFQRYYSGDLVYGYVCEYFPSGYTWWFMKQLLGGRYTDHVGGHYHMDDTGIGAGHMDGGSGGEYTCGTRTVAKCAMSIYGALPLDKDIVAAYVIVSPDGTDPSKDPIGRSWTGGPVMYCHYHALPKDHYEDGETQHLHGTAGYPNDQYFDDDGNFVDPHPGVYYASDDIVYRDESAYRLWGTYSHRPSDDRWAFYGDTFENDIGELGGLYDTGFYHHIGTPKKSIMSSDGSKVIGYGYDETSFPDPAGFTTYNLSNTDVKKKQKFHYIVLDDNRDIVKVYPDSMVWKTETKAQIEKTIRRHTAQMELVVSDGTVEGTVAYDFEETDSTLYGAQMPEKSQPVTGYFDMSWTNTKGYVTGGYSVEEKAANTWDHPVIFQEGQQGSRGYKNNKNNKQTGNIPRAIDVTPIVKKLYERRIARRFSCDAGTTYDKIRAWEFYQPVLEDVDKLDEDLRQQNDFIPWYNTEGKRQILLTDYCSYPELNGNLNAVPTVSEEGDKYELAPFILEIYCSYNVSESNPIVINGTNCFFQTDSMDRVDFLQTGTLSSAEDVASRLDQLFSGLTKDYVSSSGARYYSDKINVFELLDIDKSCYSLFGLEAKAYYAVQNRVVNVTDTYTENEVKSLVSNRENGYWEYSVYSELPQSFTVDLLRAPLLVKERGWRYSAGSEDEPGDGIKTYFYDKPFSEDSIISCIKITPSFLEGCGFRVMSRRSGGSVWETLLEFEYDESRERYTELYPEYSGVEMSASELPKFFYIEPTLGRFVKVECDSVQRYRGHAFRIDSYQGIDDNNQIDTSGGYQMIITNDGMTFNSFNGASFVGVACISNDENSGKDLSYSEWMDMIREAEENGRTSTEYGDIIHIVASQTLVSDPTKMRLAFDRYYPLDTDNPPDSVGEEGTGRITLFIKEWCGGLSSFGVYGTPFKTERGGGSESDPESGGMYLTMTGRPDETQSRLDYSKTTYELPERPTQIWRVSVGQGESGGIELKEAGEDAPLVWQTKAVDMVIGDEVSATTVTAYQITGGNYRYDPVKCAITIPRVNADGMDWNDFEEEVRGTDSLWTRMPTMLSVVYWAGNGKSVTLQVTADGNGPSYMVEKNAINSIVSPSYLTKTGQFSCAMLDPSGNVQNNLPIPLVCYNDRPATLSIEDSSRSNAIQGTVHFNAGEFRKPAFNGKELVGTNLLYDDAFIALFGEHCERCYGKCSTEVTLTGPPNFLISGHVVFEAPATTRHEIDFNGKQYEYVERTGGIDQGMLVVRCAPISSGDGRVTKCYKKPTLLIYAKERDPYRYVKKSGESSSSSSEDPDESFVNTNFVDETSANEIFIFGK